MFRPGAAYAGKYVRMGEWENGREFQLERMMSALKLSGIAVGRSKWLSEVDLCEAKGQCAVSR